ncbi:hypothetical protein ACT2CI_00810 [Candidatus Vidania fulgoroideorum]
MRHRKKKYFKYKERKNNIKNLYFLLINKKICLRKRNSKIVENMFNKIKFGKYKKIKNIIKFKENFLNIKKRKIGFYKGDYSKKILLEIY